jgi:hypothetical protein
MPNLGMIKIIKLPNNLSVSHPHQVEPLWVPGAGHNDVELHAAYLERLRAFIEGEVANNSADSKAETDTSRTKTTTAAKNSI